MSIRYRNYILFYLKTLCIVVLIFFNKHLLSQQVFYQDICNCGVTGAGFSTSTGFGSGSFDIYIEPGSIVNKAFLFIQRFGNAKETNIILNNKSYNFNYNNQVSANFTLPFTDSLSAVHAIDITGDIQTSQNTYDITIPVQNNQSINVAYGNVYLYVIYENPSLTPTTTTVFLNNYDMTHEEESYSSINLNPVNNNYPIGFATYTDRLGNIPSTHDGSYIIVENNLLGLVKGTDQVNNLWGGAGVKGHFYYQNNQLYGLDDDVPNNTMGGSDGLADISSYLSNLTTNLNWKLVWERPNTFYNIYSGFFLTYTSSCDTFTTTVTQDTTICYGETLQLQATGGQIYEWTAVTDPASGLDVLSCTDCPNPVFTGNSSQVYTVRIWNNDSCSVVKPVRIGVSQPEEIKTEMLRSICSFSTGKITVLDLPDKAVQLGAVTPNGDTISPSLEDVFSELAAGDYSVFYIDEFGCSVDTLITVEPIINTVAQFNAYPKKGTAPIQINLTNQSQNATDYSWWLNNEYQGNSFSRFYTDTSGVYEIELIAWRNDSICADTTSFTVIVFDSLVVTLPNVFTPNNDGVNDYFNIETNLPVVYELSILNRWGNVLFENKGKLTKGTNNLWNGKTKNSKIVTDGTYFYIISFQLDEEEVNCEITECEVRKEGFVQVFGR